jgi:hypothetical protein
MANSNPQQRIKIMTKELPPEIDEAVAKDVTEIMWSIAVAFRTAGAMARMAKVTGLPLRSVKLCCRA